jgi:acyl transferase domain-containing protein
MIHESTMTLPAKSPIAVVGIAYRAPGTGRKGLYEFLADAQSAFSPVPKDRFQQEAYHFKDPEKGGVFSPDGAHFLSDDIYAFDAPFFNMTAEEARSMDPQHRAYRAALHLFGPHWKSNN